MSLTAEDASVSPVMSSPGASCTIPPLGPSSKLFDIDASVSNGAEAGASTQPLEAGSDTDAASKPLDSVAPPSIELFAASDTQLPGGGGTVELSWHVVGADTFAIHVGGVARSLGTSASEESVPVDVTESTSFALVASNSHGTVQAEVAVSVSAQGTQDWLVEVGHEDRSFADYPLSLQADSAGRLYCLSYAAATPRTEASEVTYALHMMDASGALKSTRKVIADGASPTKAVAIAMDTNDTLRLVGIAEGLLEQRVFVAEIPAGADWQTPRYLEYDFGAAILDRVFASRDGYLVQTESSAAEPPDASVVESSRTLIRFSSNDEVEWSWPLLETESVVGFGPSGDVLLMQPSLSSSGTFLLTQVSAAGELSWSRLYPLAEGSMLGIQVGPDGSIAFAYYQQGVRLSLLGEDGALLWDVAYNADVNSYVSSISTLGLDADRNVYFSATTRDALYAETHGAENMFLVKFGAAGAFHWGSQLVGTGTEFPNSLLADAHGNVFLAASSTTNFDGAHEALNFETFDVVIQRFR